MQGEVTVTLVGFEGHMVAEKLGRRRWRLVEDLVFHSHGVAGTVTVPAGFETDFASVPRVPLIHALFGGRGHAAAVVHDWLYQAHPEGVEKRDADLAFLEALLDEGLAQWRAWAMYAAVACMGGKHWRSGPGRLRC